MRQKILKQFTIHQTVRNQTVSNVKSTLVQHLLEGGKIKNDTIKILAGTFSVNVNKPQSTYFYLQRPQNDIIANSETPIFSESGNNSISSIPKEPIKFNKRNT